MELQSFDPRPISDLPASQRVRSAHRIHCDAQVEVIKRQIGSLEVVRGKLGLSQRKICQLLMVDPSAWTRWTRNGDPAPPHIYRALQWYLIINEKIPGLTPQYFVGKDPEFLHQTALRKISEESSRVLQRIEKSDLVMGDLGLKNATLQDENQHLQHRIETLEAAIKTQRAAFYLVAASAIAVALTIYFTFIKNAGRI